MYIYIHTYMFIYMFIMNTSPYYPEEVKLLGCNSQTKQSQAKPSQAILKRELPKPLCHMKPFVKQVSPQSQENHILVGKHSRIGKPVDRSATKAS